jgi:hypothetical protein
VKVARDAGEFTRRGFRAREFFPHQVLWLPKPYPDAYLNLERRGVARERVLAGRFVQINVYSDWLDGLPDALFTDPAVNWHGQQLGKKGLIAAAGLFIEDRAAFVTLLQSDLCQQIYRSAELKQVASARLNNRFRYWYRILFNAVLDFACDESLETVHSPTAAHIVATTRKAITPDLFVQIYDSVAERYECERRNIDRAEYWSVATAPNAAHVVRLAAGAAEHPAPARKVICIVHDIEENVDTEVSPAECRAALVRMLEIEREHGVRATYTILGRLFRDKAAIIAAHGDHDLAFHSFDHRLDDLSQLARVREVDLQIKGYRTPRSKITAELSDYALVYWNFEWIICSERTFECQAPKVENGLVKVPIYMDDWMLHTGELTRERWEPRLLYEIRDRDFVAFGLHDCYAAHWLDWYGELLETLKGMGELWTVDQAVSQAWLRSTLTPPRDAPGR